MASAGCAKRKRFQHIQDLTGIQQGQSPWWWWRDPKPIPKAHLNQSHNDAKPIPNLSKNDRSQTGATRAISRSQDKPNATPIPNRSDLQPASNPFRADPITIPDRSQTNHKTIIPNLLKKRPKQTKNHNSPILIPSKTQKDPNPKTDPAAHRSQTNPRPQNDFKPMPKTNPKWTPKRQTDRNRSEKHPIRSQADSTPITNPSTIDSKPIPKRP